MNRLWQIMPSMAFKLGLYDGAITIGELRAHGDFGVGQFAALDGELTLNEGRFFHARCDGSVRIAADDEELCFAQVCFFKPSSVLEVGPAADHSAFEAFLLAAVPFPNDFIAFRLTGEFQNIVPTAPPGLSKPYPAFADAVKLRKSFPADDVIATIVGLYSPAFTADTGIPGFHYHMISADQKISGHVTSFELGSGRLEVARLREITLQLPRTPEYAAVKLNAGS